VFQADPAKLPVYVSAANDAGGYAIYKVVKVIDARHLTPAGSGWRGRVSAAK